MFIKGQADNLKRKLKDYSLLSETNSKLRHYFYDFYNEVRCWYCPLTEIKNAERKKLEVELIQFFKPKFNTKSKR